MKPIPRAAHLLSAIALVGAAAASITTLVWSGAFPTPPDAPAVNRALAEARGWSAVTLVLALPVLAVAATAAARGSLRGRLGWAGALGYLVYTYLEFAVSPPFTPLYLVHVVTFACAIPALVLVIASLDLDEVARGFGERAPRRTVAAFGAVFAGFLSLAWLRGIVERTAAGEFGWPVGEAAIGHVVHALDLGLQVPLGLAAALLLARRRAAGFTVAALMLVNAVLMGAALTAMVAVAEVAAGRGVVGAAPFAAVALIALALAIAYFRALAPAARRADRGAPRAGGVHPRPGVA